MDINEILEIPPYSLEKGDKRVLLNNFLIELVSLHYSNSELYRNMLDATGVDIAQIKEYEDIPYLPVSLFKDLDLLSIDKKDIVKTMTSSGTTGQKVSKIYLDKETSLNQTKVLTKIVSSLIGTKRVPMIILDSSGVLKNRNMFSARGAGILGFSMFGSKRTYALDEEMELNIEELKEFLEKHKGETIFLFGFTFMIWEHFYKCLQKSEHKLDLSNAILIHGGGWKKLISESVSSEKFKESLHQVCKIKPVNIHDYYGMVEQAGSIYIECEQGHLHTPIFSDIIIRRPLDLSVADIGEKGVIEVVSILPKSYPGHALLTEDEGVILGEDDCNCGRKGKYFKIEGRLKNAEIRGCSDTYASGFGNLQKIKYVVGDESTVENMPKVRALKPFDDRVILFFNDLSKELIKSGRGFSDVITFGFWCRKSSLLQEKSNYEHNSYRLGRGVVFHIAPSNVPVNFAFSFAAALLAGNANIVRLPSADFPQVNIICNAITKLINSTYKDMLPYISMVKYPRDIKLNDKFSAICHSRVIWGGDATIRDIRQSPLKSRANEITFADRYSVCVINADEYLLSDNRDKIISDFYNDTYFSDQNACTSPRLIMWLGDGKREAKQDFWKRVYDLVQEKYPITAVQIIGKLAALYKISSLSCVRSTINNPYTTRIELSNISEDIMDYKFNSGFFFEYDANELNDILPLITERCQTMTYFGLQRSDIENWISIFRPQGIDRIVPIGKSMDFTLVWDGYDLILTLSRVINITCKGIY